MNTKDKLELIEQVNKRVNNGMAVQLQSFNQLISMQPKESYVKVNTYSGNARYLPIRIVETMLRMIFGVFQVEVIECKVIANSIVCTVHLKVYHPILNEWLTYAGIGAIPIELKKGSEVMNQQNIQSKALHKNAPAAKSFAVANAAKSIGALFGAELNNREDETISLNSMYSDRSISDVDMFKIKGLLDACRFEEINTNLHYHYLTHINWIIENNDSDAYDIIYQKLQDIVKINSAQFGDGKETHTDHATAVRELIANDDAKEEMKK